MITLVFTTGAGILFLLSGLFKIFSLKESAATIKKLEILPQVISNSLGIVFPFFEVILGILIILFSPNLIVNFVAACITVLFMVINYKTISERKKS
ncbi:MauE/DoxX family redox-associated membrane protein [Bacillus velezensis]|uniref:MauE/DoxX family redox-associated membrane protein n=1 Tax=Bacillus velezensis TaxID=492670 RepID=UPI003EBFB36B